MTRRPFIAGNWKLNHPPHIATGVISELIANLPSDSKSTIAIFPPTVSLHASVTAAKESDLYIGIQEVDQFESGAYTGANSATFARQMGCTYALIGHSERRQLFGETNEGVNAKVHATLKAGLLPMVCIGETLAQRKAGELYQVVEEQLTMAIKGLTADQIATVTFAYEPVWAIGTGVTATPEQAQEMHQFIRSKLSVSTSNTIADSIRILYGGSVKPTNAATLLACPDIDGALVGGASLKSTSFLSIVRSSE